MGRTKRKINWKKYIPSKKTRSKIKKGLRTTRKYFKNMSDGIDETFSIPKSNPDYTLDNQRRRRRKR